MATVGIAEGETSMVGLGTGMQHASIEDYWIRFGGKKEKILLTPVSELNDDHSESHNAVIELNGKRYYVVGMSSENALAMTNSLTADEFRFAMAKFEVVDLRKFDKFESEMAALEKVIEKGQSTQDAPTQMTGDENIDILCTLPPQLPNANFSLFGKISSFLGDHFGKEVNYSGMAGDEEEMKISWKQASCGLIMGADYTALASFGKTDGVLGEAAWMAATLSFFITLFGVVAPLKMPRFLFGLAAILTGLSYMAFVAMKFA